MKKKSLIKGALLGLGVVGVMFASTTNAEAVITEAMDGSIGTITICNESYSDDCITIMDRNLGATTNDVTSTGSYGNFYQWGNNYGFNAFGEFNLSYEDPIDCSMYNPLSPFNGNEVIITTIPDYCYPKNDNLWGDTTNTVEARRGPCDEGYHVPSADEWSNLMNIWAGTDVEGDMSGGNFQSDFMIPFAGEFDVSDGNGYRGYIDAAVLWSSTPSPDGARTFSIWANRASIAAEFDGLGRAQGRSVRCFRNEPILPPSTIDVLVTIEGGTLTIGIDTGAITNGALNLGTLKISNNVQTKTGEFGANSFRVDDQKGVESGYYTTLSVTDLVGENPAHVIGAENIQLKSENSTVSLISGTPVNDSYVLFSNQIQNWVTATGSITYFNRQNTDTADAGRLGKYGDNLQIKVTVPAHTMADTYRGTITYTLYDLDQ